ncbi:MAG: 8-amino-7-oxononanoate synthase [Kiritimatiellae bacterium]|nr:8-amino-7-oxononanoate synthase [Kiritimatiellia bacterium]
MNATAGFGTLLEEELAALEAAGLRRACRACDGPTGPRTRLGGRDVLVLASNDYCDLARDPRVVRAAADAAARWGAGSGGSRLITGSQPPHAALERHLAAFKGTGDAVVFGSGYMANLGTVAALCGKGDAILSDALNHASIIDGCRLSRAAVTVYRHGDMDDLARALAAVRGARRVLVVSDAVFSMDGDLLDLPRFLALCRAHGAVSMIDEAHATGVLGATGRGLCEHFGCGRPDVLMGTLSKALGSAGGYVAGSRALCDFLRNKARSFVFSTSLPAPAMAAADAALAALEAEPERAAAARGNAAFLVAELAARGVAAATQSAIVPIPVGDEAAAVRASERLLAEGVWVPAIRYPTVARGAARLRASVMSSHTREDLAFAAGAIARALRG